MGTSSPIVLHWLINDTVLLDDCECIVLHISVHAYLRLHSSLSFSVITCCVVSPTPHFSVVAVVDILSIGGSAAHSSL